MKNRGNVFIFLLIIALSFSAGYFFFKARSLEKQNSIQSQSNKTKEPKIKKPRTGEHWNGKKNVRYVWVEYSDLQCPYCKQIHPELTKLLNVYSGEIAWVYRHFPLPSHPKAPKSAEAVECATQQQGNQTFWKMTSLIFEKMPELEIDQLTALAKSIGLDETKFKTCLDSNRFEKKVKESFAEGETAGVNSTPTSFIYDLKTGNQTKVIGAPRNGFEDLRKYLDTFVAQNK